MLKNKKRTLMTMLGIIISVAMITAVSTAAVSFMDFLQRDTLEDTGYWHVRYNQVTKEQYDKLAADPNTEDIFYRKPLGFALYADPSKNSTPYLYLDGYSKEAFDAMNITLLEGRLPENDREIVIPKHFLNNNDFSYQVGDVLTLELGERLHENGGEMESLSQNVPLQRDEEGNISEQYQVTKEPKQYTIVGIMARPSYERYYSSAYSILTYLDQEQLASDPASLLDAFVSVTKISNSIYHDGASLAASIGLDESNVEFNDDVLRYYGVSRYFDSFNVMVNGLASILITIIMIGSVSLIYNSFAISLSERSKQFGMLSSVGVTKKQKQNAVFFEAFSLGVMSIPIGIIAGLVGMWITFYFINPIFMNAFDIEIPLKLVVSYPSILVAIFFSSITIWISAYIPARKASKISAIDAIRQSSDIKISSKQLKTSRIHSAVFGLPGSLAIKNMKRNRKRYRSLVFSLFISFVLFTSVGSYVNYASQGLQMGVEQDNYDVQVGNINNNNAGNILSDIKQLEEVTHATLLTYPNVYYTWDMKDALPYLTEEYKQDIFTQMGVSENEYDDSLLESYTPSIGHRFLDDEAFREYAKKIGINAEEYINSNKLKGILINRVRTQTGYSINEVTPFTLKAGDTITPSNQIYDEASFEFVPVVEPERTAVIGFVTTKVPDHIGSSYVSSGATLLFPLSSLDLFLGDGLDTTGENLRLNNDILLTTTSPEKIDSLLNDILENYNSKAYVYNRSEEALRSSQLIFVFQVFAYGFIILISLICMANLCNTISTSFALRRREFAMLKSAGMTPKAFHQMIRLESMLYGIKALAYGIPISMLINYYIKMTVATNFGGNFSFPLGTYLFGIFAVFAVVFVAMVYSSAKIRHETIIDGLKSDHV